MPADYLSRLPGAKDAVASITAFDPFQADLFDLQMQDEHYQMLQTYMTKNEWPAKLAKLLQKSGRKSLSRQKQSCLDQAH